MDYKRGVASLIVGLVVAILLIGGGVYYYQFIRGQGYQKPVEPQEPSAINTDTTNPPVGEAGRKTYRNEQYGFQLKYPAEFVLSPQRTIHGDDRIPLNQRAEIGGATFSIILERQPCPAPHVAYGWRQKEALLGGQIYQSVIDGYATKIFLQGCYECYDVTDPVTGAVVANPELERNGFTIVTCNPRESVCLNVSLRDSISNLEKTRSAIFDVASSLSFSDNFDKVDCTESYKG